MYKYFLYTVFSHLKGCILPKISVVYSMKLEVLVSSYLQKYLRKKYPSGIPFRRTERLAMLWLGHYKCRTNKSKVTTNSRYKLNAPVFITMSDAMFQVERLKSQQTMTVSLEFCKQVRIQFYEEFFRYVDFRRLDNTIRDNDETIHFIIEEFMLENGIDEDDVQIETLKKNYWRYRKNGNSSLESLINNLKDDGK